VRDVVDQMARNERAFRTGQWGGVAAGDDGELYRGRKVLSGPRVGGSKGPDLPYVEWGRIRYLSDGGADRPGPAARCAECGTVTWVLAMNAQIPRAVKNAHRKGCGQPLGKLDREYA
jgi:hypothetical protein